MAYRITYAFDRETIFTTVVGGRDNADALYNAKRYINGEHGAGSFKKLLALSFIQIKDGTCV